jgi:hypothetical protein
MEVTRYQDRAWSVNGLRTEELQKLAKDIFEFGKITDVYHQNYGTNDPATTHGKSDMANVLNGSVSYTVEREGFPIKYSIHMDGLKVTEIIEMIQR